MERSPAAIHIRARDLHEDDVVVSEGRVNSFKPYPDREGWFILQWDRPNFHTRTTHGDEIMLVIIDKDKHAT